MEQFFKVVDKDKTEVRWQSEWFGKFSLQTSSDLTSRFTLAQMLAHETSANRYERRRAGHAVTELMYPMLQGYDSVAMRADVEFGGTDQKFNILAGRELMGQLGMAPQDVLLVPLIPGTDGRKMSKSFGNTVDISAAPLEQYSRVMALGDDALPLLFETLTDAPLAEVAEMRGDLAAGAADAMGLKRRLARLVVSQFHAPGAAEEAEFRVAAALLAARGAERRGRARGGRPAGDRRAAAGGRHGREPQRGAPPDRRRRRVCGRAAGGRAG